MRHRIYKPIGEKWVTPDEYSWRCAVCGKPANRSVEKNGKIIELCAEHVAENLLKEQENEQNN